MNLKDKINRQLQRLASSGSFEVNTERLSVEDERGGRIECELAELGSIGCTFERFEYQTNRLANASMAQLERLSHALAARLNYLLEPIRFLEADVGDGVVQMRSSPPSQAPEGTDYYELLIRCGGGVSLRRYRKEAGRPRDPAPAHVTREVLCRLAADVVAAVESELGTDK